MTRDTIVNRYYEWLSKLVCENRYSKRTSYSKLLMRLHSIEFRYLLPRDQNRAEDGISLRWRFICELDDSEHYDHYNNMLADLDGPCSVLEMMISLATHCEDIMDDTSVGDRTGQWFWGMIRNLGLGSMYDSRYDREYVDETIERFLNREYRPDGKGGLFTIRNCDRDLRDVEIWHQLCWYLDDFDGYNI